MRARVCELSWTWHLLAVLSRGEHRVCMITYILQTQSLTKKPHDEGCLGNWASLSRGAGWRNWASLSRGARSKNSATLSPGLMNLLIITRHTRPYVPGPPSQEIHAPEGLGLPYLELRTHTCGACSVQPSRVRITCSWPPDAAWTSASPSSVSARGAWCGACSSVRTTARWPSSDARSSASSSWCTE